MVKVAISINDCEKEEEQEERSEVPKFMRSWDN
jgi:hypothetical protein